MASRTATAAATLAACAVAALVVSVAIPRRRNADPARADGADPRPGAARPVRSPGPGGVLPAEPLPDLPCLRGGVERIGAHFRVVSLATSPECADLALDAAESVWPLCREWFGAPESVAEKPTVWVHARLDSYLETERALTGGRLAENRAFAHVATRTAHVLLQAEFPDSLRGRLGLFEPTRRLIAHEAVHLARFCTSPTAPRHPLWLADGLALAISDEACRRAGVSGPFETGAVTSTRIADAQRLLREGAFPSLAGIIAGETGGLAPQSRYAARHLAARFLFDGTRAAALRAFLRERFAEEDDAGWAVRFAAGLEGLRTVAEAAAAESEFPRWIARFRPRWSDPNLSLDVRGDGNWVQWGGAEGRTAWRLDTVRVVAASGEVELHGRSDAWCALEIGLADGNRASVPFLSDAGERHRFDVEVDGPELVVRRDGEEIDRLRIHARATSFGVTAGPGSLAIWTSVDVVESAR